VEQCHVCFRLFYVKIIFFNRSDKNLNDESIHIIHSLKSILLRPMYLSNQNIGFEGYLIYVLGGQVAQVNLNPPHPPP